METELIQVNNSSDINNSNDFSNSAIHRSSQRIGDDTTLNDLIRSDRSLVIFLMVLGFYIDDDRNTYAVKILARIWQASLLVFGGIGFCWFTFIFGGHDVANLYNSLTSSTSKGIGMFIYFGYVLAYFIVPIVQVGSLIYGITNLYKHMDRPANAAIVSPLLASCKRSTVVYFTCMILLVITIEPIAMTRSWYETRYVE